MVPPTVTVRIRQALQHAQQRAAEFSRTQQLELSPNLFVRIAPGGRRFLVFQLEGEPGRETAEAISAALGLKNPSYDWYQGATLRSLTVSEEGEDRPQADPEVGQVADQDSGQPDSARTADPAH